MTGDLCKIDYDIETRFYTCHTCGDEWHYHVEHNCPLGMKYGESNPSRAVAIAITAGLILLAGGGGLLMSWLVGSILLHVR